MPHACEVLYCCLRHASLLMFLLQELLRFYIRANDTFAFFFCCATFSKSQVPELDSLLENADSPTRNPRQDGCGGGSHGVTSWIGPKFFKLRPTQAHRLPILPLLHAKHSAEGASLVNQNFGSSTNKENILMTSM